MNEKIIDLRRFYFSFLYVSFIYLGVLILLLGNNVKPSEPDLTTQTLIGFTGVIPAVIYFLKKSKYIFEKKLYIKLLIFCQIPLIVGTVLSLIHLNYIYFLISYPIFITGCLILIPTKKSVKGKS